ncbi:hypothetical protein BO71DRAFT_404524 [Aspergillus ellipticus CBS 707.79]|uniref:Uncharacterized protein n=1 Tax=Aspergillus ellipticus CBS 707.79 TaxID=1448320 RepID=A0A319CTD5_9EURO|nr:hypothetical protein BO71DRAFT_404524 [Aspergillus ellipticus CBS 707.79]
MDGRLSEGVTELGLGRSSEQQALEQQLGGYREHQQHHQQHQASKQASSKAPALSTRLSGLPSTSGFKKTSPPFETDPSVATSLAQLAASLATTIIHPPASLQSLGYRHRGRDRRTGRKSSCFSPPTTSVVSRAPTSPPVRRADTDK